MAAAPMPQAVPGKKPGVVIGNWNFAVPANTAPDKAKAGLAFLKWFVTPQAQRAYAEAGGIPVRSDTLKSDLASKPQFAWMPAYLETVEAQSRRSATPGISLGGAGARTAAQPGADRGAHARQGAEPSRGRDRGDLHRKTGRKTGRLPALPE